MPPIIAAGLVNAGTSLLGNIFGSIFGASEKDKQAARLDKLYAERKKETARAYGDLQHVQEGQTSIDPEAALAYKTSERQAANAIAKSERASTNSNEAISSVAHITNNAAGIAEKISAAEGARRRIAAENAKKTGVASAQALNQLELEKEQTKRGAFNDVDRSVASHVDFLSGIGSDISSALLFKELYGGNKTPDWVGA